MMMIKTVNPATGEVIQHYQQDDEAGLTKKLAQIWASWKNDWMRRSLTDRLAVLSRAAEVLEERRDELAMLITMEMGKPISASRDEVDKCAWLCRHYVRHSASYLEPETYQTEATHSYVRYDPVGPILAVMPWNFPLWQVFRFAVPNLAAGNVGLLKHAANTTGCALAIEELLVEADLPEGCFSVVLVDHETTARLMGDPRIRGVTLTGSDRAGRTVGGNAGKHLKKTVLELGGSDPCIVLDDANLEEAVKGAVASRYLNSGQSCINAKRIIVARSLYDEFIERFRAKVEALVVGDPTNESTNIGPLARADLRDTVHDQVRRTLKHRKGSTLLLGGEPLQDPGFFYAPTILGGVDPQAPAATEEVFGPVATFIVAEHDDAAIDIANMSRFGLGAAIWTTDVERAERMAARIEAGMVFINEIVKSDPRLPFGGVKDSGYGRELADQGMREFTNAKTIWVNSTHASATESVE